MMAFTHDTAMLFWSAVALPPLATSIVYFRTSPISEPLMRRLAVSAHGIAIAWLYVGALLIGGFGKPHPEYTTLFAAICGGAALLIVYSVWRFKGHKAIHLLQVINLGALVFTYAFGSMAVRGVWL